MKKLISVLTLLLMISFADAQPPVRIPGAKKNSPTLFDNSWKLFSSPTGYNTDIKMIFKLNKDEIKGQTLSFSYNTNDMVLEIAYIQDGDRIPDYDNKKTIDLPNNTFAYNLYFQLGEHNLPYGHRNGYLMYFHKKGNEKPIWICTYTPTK